MEWGDGRVPKQKGGRRGKSRERDKLQNEREKISLETGVCVLAFPYVQFSPVTSCSGRQPGLVKELCKNSTEALTASAEPCGCGAG